MLEPYGVKGKNITIQADRYEAETDLSDEVCSTTTDSGGGVPAACRRLGRQGSSDAIPSPANPQQARMDGATSR